MGFILWASSAHLQSAWSNASRRMVRPVQNGWAQVPWWLAMSATGMDSEGRGYVLCIFQTCSKLSLMYSCWKTILRNQIEPPNVALTFFQHYAQELEVAYFCQPHKIHTLWFPTTLKIFKNWLIHSFITRQKITDSEIIIKISHSPKSSLFIYYNFYHCYSY